MKFGLTRIFDEISNRVHHGILWYFSFLAMWNVRHSDEDHEIFYRLHLQTFQTTPFASDVALRYLQFLAHFRESETDENTEKNQDFLISAKAGKIC